MAAFKGAGSGLSCRFRHTPEGHKHLQAHRYQKMMRCHYEHEELSLDPDPSKLREDFARPVRYFMLPRETFFKVA